MIPALLVGCGWNHLPSGQFVLNDEPLWSAGDVVATEDGLYVRLPRAGGLALVKEEAPARLVPIGDARVLSAEAAPDGRSVVVFADRYRCTTEDLPASVDEVDECEAEDLETQRSLLLVADGEVRSDSVLPAAYDAVAFSDDARFAVAYFDFSEEFQVDGVLDLTGVVVLDLQEEHQTLVSVGFAAEQVRFVTDASGATTGAVVLSRNQVAVVDLTREPPVVTVTYPLSLDPDVVVDPVGLDLTPDGRYALISARTQSELYVLDLVEPAINLVELAGTPSGMAVADGVDQTVMVYGRTAVVELVDHERFEVEEIALDEAMDRVTLSGDTALLWSASGRHDLYRLDLESHELVEYVLQNPAQSLIVAPTGEYAVATTLPDRDGGSGVDAIYDANPGLELVDLNDDRTTPFLLEGPAVGVAISAADGGLRLLVLQEGVDYLYELDLYTRQERRLDLVAPPVAIGSLPDGRFFVTHDEAVGLISFFEPGSDALTSVGGFGTLGSMTPVRLVEVTP